MSIKQIPAAAPLAVALSLALSSPVYAETAAATDAATDGDARATELDTVQVYGKVDYGYVQKRSTSATKTDTELQDVPQSITVVTQDLIRDQAMQNLGDVVRYVPGVTMAQGEGNRDTPVMRGNSTTGDMFVDGMRDDTQYFRDLYNIERVEALKGPNAMIFGRGGSGGVINRVTKQADWETVRDLSLQVGSWNKRRLAGDFGQAINDTAAFRVTGMVEDSESYRDGYEAKRWGINPTFAFTAGDNTTITLGYEHFKDERVADRGIPSSITPFNGRRLPVETDPSTFFGDPDRSPTWADVDALSALVDHDFGNGLTLRNRTRIADYDKFYQNVYAGGPVNAAGTLAEIRAYSNATQRKNFFNQTDFVWALDGRIKQTLLFGAELGRQETDNFRQTGYFGAPGSTVTSVFVPFDNPRYTGPMEFRQSATDADNHSVAKVAALYAQDQIEFSPQWQAIVGLRYDRFDVDFRNNRNGQAISSTDNLLSPRVGLVYKPLDPLSLYASYSIAYVPRAGDQLSSLTPTNKAFDPEEFRNYEIGAKWEVVRGLALTAAAYRLERTNVIAPDPSDPTQSILIDGQRVKGFELGLAGNITEAWSVMGAYAWQEGDIPDSLTKPAQLPEQTASLWNRFDFSNRWGVGLGAIYRGEFFASTSNQVVIKSYTRYDAAVFFDVNDNLGLQLNLENIFDKQYFVSANNDNNITPGSPRAAYLSVNLKF
ncbi:TonB-dependent receptor [Lysobacter solisilvae (ex Woo and Kim 2020)]|uniref:TonB-dependent siderophore receptor n=1 Tax=Agrilutibacter terrestris TaxID=2865112 RepID=A0A7H0FYN1_9GAMM|nr:TonB-dependent siderophore receptor [Lysobacter terrestris]QNP41147.1 TonB-dependent siderophore receptor [Lysobacter terrestris]